MTTRLAGLVHDLGPKGEELHALVPDALDRRSDRQDLAEGDGPRPDVLLFSVEDAGQVDPKPRIGHDVVSPASISGTVTIVGGHPGPRWPMASANARTRVSSTRNRTGG